MERSNPAREWNAVPEYLFQPEETRLRQEMAYNLD